MRPPSPRDCHTLFINKESTSYGVHHHKLYNEKLSVHSLINKESLQMHTSSQIMRGNCCTFYN